MVEIYDRWDERERKLRERHEVETDKHFSGYTKLYSNGLKLNTNKKDNVRNLEYIG